MATDEDIAGSNSDVESIPYKERFGKWNVENENIFKEGRKEPVADNSLNNNGEKVDTQTPESQATSATRGNLLKQPGQSNGENNLKNQDSYTPQEKVRSPVQQASFSGCRDSAETAGVPNKTKYSRANHGRSRSKTRKSRKRKHRSSSLSSSSLTSSSSSSDIFDSETSSSSSLSDSEKKKRKKSKKK